MSNAGRSIKFRGGESELTLNKKVKRVEGVLCDVMEVVIGPQKYGDNVKHHNNVKKIMGSITSALSSSKQRNDNCPTTPNSIQAKVRNCANPLQLKQKMPSKTLAKPNPMSKIAYLRKGQIEGRGSELKSPVLLQVSNAKYGNYWGRIMKPKKITGAKVENHFQLKASNQAHLKDKFSKTTSNESVKPSKSFEILGGQCHEGQQPSCQTVAHNTSLCNQSSQCQPSEIGKQLKSYFVGSSQANLLNQCSQRHVSNLDNESSFVLSEATDKCKSKFKNEITKRASEGKICDSHLQYENNFQPEKVFVTKTGMGITEAHCKSLDKSKSEDSVKSKTNHIFEKPIMTSRTNKQNSKDCLHDQLNERHNCVCPKAVSRNPKVDKPKFNVNKSMVKLDEDESKSKMHHQLNERHNCIHSKAVSVHHTKGGHSKTNVGNSMVKLDDSKSKTKMYHQLNERHNCIHPKAVCVHHTKCVKSKASNSMVKLDGSKSKSKMKDQLNDQQYPKAVNRNPKVGKPMFKVNESKIKLDDAKSKSKIHVQRNEQHNCIRPKAVCRHQKVGKSKANVKSTVKFRDSNSNSKINIATSKSSSHVNSSKTSSTANLENHECIQVKCKPNRSSSELICKPLITHSDESKSKPYKMDYSKETLKIKQKRRELAQNKKEETTEFIGPKTSNSEPFLKIDIGSRKDMQQINIYLSEEMQGPINKCLKMFIDEFEHLLGLQYEGKIMKSRKTL